MSKKKKRGLPATRVPSIYTKCDSCTSLQRYSGVEKDSKTGEVLRRFSCRDKCPYV